MSDIEELAEIIYLFHLEKLGRKGKVFNELHINRKRIYRRASHYAITELEESGINKVKK